MLGKLSARVVATLGAAAAWLLALACASIAPAATVESRDSAGIQIVENSGPAWAEGEVWRLSAEPILEIGALDGEPEYNFGRAHGPVRLDDGTIVVADMMSNLISFYSGDGEFLRASGGDGQGPGEFTQLYRHYKFAGDSLVGLNPPSATSIFSPDGEFVRRFSLEPVPGRGNIWWLGQLDPGALVAFSLQREGTRELEPPPDAPPGQEFRRLDVPERGEFYRDTLQFFLYDMEGHVIDSVVKLPGQFMAENRTFAPHAAYAFDGDDFLHSPGDILEVRRFSLVTDESGAPSGLELEQIVRRPPLRDLTVTESVKDDFRASERERFDLMEERMPPGSFNREFMETRLRDMNYPAALPDHGNRMYVDALGNLWVQDYRIGDRGPFRWSVFQRNGTWLGVVETPENFTVNEIGEDYVLGIGLDDFEVNYVQMYRLEKPARR